MHAIVPPTRQQTLEVVTEYASQLLRSNDPRAVLEAFLLNASQIAALTIAAEKFDAAKVAALFGQNLVDALRIEKPTAQPSIITKGN